MVVLVRGRAPLLELTFDQDKFGRIEGLKVAICGDVLHSRVARSNIWGLLKLGADVAVAVTGIAGPGGGTEEKPVGTVCFGWVAGNLTESTRVMFPGSRQEVRERAVQFALWRLWRMVGPAGMA